MTRVYTTKEFDIYDGEVIVRVSNRDNELDDYGVVVEFVDIDGKVLERWAVPANEGKLIAQAMLKVIDESGFL